MSRVAQPTSTDYVWLPHTWGRLLVFHQPADRADRADRPWSDNQGHEGVIASWILTRCGRQMYDAVWEPDASPRSGRFYIGRDRGFYLPRRLLATDHVRPCRRCYVDA